MRQHRWTSVLALLALLAGLFVAGAPSRASGGMSIPSTGSIGPTGHFLACRSTSANSRYTDHYNQQNVFTRHDCGEGRRSHKGVDISGSKTPGISPVYAALAGTVWSAERANGFGWRVILRHGKGIGSNGRYTYTLYGHMGDCSGRSFIAGSITPGTRVAAGQFLGYQGVDSYPSGCAGGSHVHWEVRVSDKDVSNFFLAVPASPDFYTGVQLTNGDSRLATSVRTPFNGTSATASPRPSATPTSRPTATPTVRPTATPLPRPTATPTVRPAPTATMSPRPTTTPLPTRRPARRAQPPRSRPG